MQHRIDMLFGGSLRTTPTLLISLYFASGSSQAHLLLISHIEMNAASKNIINNSSSQHALYIYARTAQPQNY